MGLAMKTKGRHRCPELICDSCREPIEVLGMAVATFERPDGDGIVPVEIYHKGVCDPGRPGSESPDAPYFRGLEGFFPLLFWDHDWGKKSSMDDEDKLGEVTIEVPRTFYE